LGGERSSIGSTEARLVAASGSLAQWLVDCGRPRRPVRREHRPGDGVPTTTKVRAAAVA